MHGKGHQIVDYSKVDEKKDQEVLLDLFVTLARTANGGRTVSRRQTKEKMQTVLSGRIFIESSLC